MAVIDCRSAFGNRRRERDRRPVGSVAVIIPTYNEHDNIELLLSELVAWFPDIRIMVVDDNSPDHTANDVRVFGARWPNVKLHLYSRSEKQGLGSAYRDGVAEAVRIWNPDRIVFMDADGSHQPHCLQWLLSERADLVIGSRYVTGGYIQGWSWWRRVLSRYGNMYARYLSGINVCDMTSGFMCFSRSCLQGIELDTCGASGYAFLMQTKFSAARLKASIVEVPITFAERRGGSSKISLSIILEGIFTPWLMRASRFLMP